MRLSVVVAALWISGATFAQDAQLDGLRATLVTLHSHATELTVDNRGARPELTVAKHQLRDWIETQLAVLQDADTQEFGEHINYALKAAGITVALEDQNLLGSLSRVQFSIQPGMLIVTAGVGILCGYDESAYGYKRINESWQRVWESEQDDYSPEKYAPQHFSAIHVSQAYDRHLKPGPSYILTLGNKEWCTSAWQPIYYRFWRIDPSGLKLLIDGSVDAWQRTGVYAVGSIAQNRTDTHAPIDVLIEFTQGSIDAGVHNREGIRHYLIQGDQVRRSDPVALSPRDFVDEWLTSDWNESAAWSASMGLEAWYRKLEPLALGDFADTTMHCKTPDLWQVAVEVYDAKSSAPAGDFYFLVRWRPPYHFTMVNVRDKPWPRCTEADPEADAWRTLFSMQEWRQ